MHWRFKIFKEVDVVEIRVQDESFATSLCVTITTLESERQTVRRQSHTHVNHQCHAGNIQIQLANRSGEDDVVGKTASRYTTEVVANVCVQLYRGAILVKMNRIPVRATFYSSFEVSSSMGIPDEAQNVAFGLFVSDLPHHGSSEHVDRHFHIIGHTVTFCNSVWGSNVDRRVQEMLEVGIRREERGCRFLHRGGFRLALLFPRTRLVGVAGGGTGGTGGMGGTRGERASAGSGSV